MGLYRKVGALFLLGLPIISCLGVTVDIDEPLYVNFDKSVPESDRPIILDGFRVWERAMPDLFTILEGEEPSNREARCTNTLKVFYVTSTDPVIVARDKVEISVAFAGRTCYSKVVYYVTDRGATLDSRAIRLVAGHEGAHILGQWGHLPEDGVGLLYPHFPGVSDLTCADIKLMCKAKACQPEKYAPCSSYAIEGGEGPR